MSNLALKDKLFEFLTFFTNNSRSALKSRKVEDTNTLIVFQPVLRKTRFLETFFALALSRLITAQASSISVNVNSSGEFACLIDITLDDFNETVVEQLFPIFYYNTGIQETILSDRFSSTVSLHKVPFL